MFADTVLAERPWSNSKIELLDKCPRAYCLKYREKLKGSQAGSAARIGTTVHAVFEYGLRTELPDEKLILSGAEPNAPMVVAVPSHTAALLDERLPYLLNLFARSPRNALSGPELKEAAELLPRAKSFVLGMQDLAAARGVQEFFLEHRTAIGVNYELQPFDVEVPVEIVDPYGAKSIVYEKVSNRDALIRGVIDFGFIAGGVYVVIDHKTGKPKDLVNYADQLRLYQLFALAEHPEIEGVQCGINHVRRPKVDWGPPHTRHEIEREVRPWLGHHLNRLDIKLRVINEGERRAKTGPLCNWCDFVDGPGLCPEGLAEVTAKPRGPRLSLPVLQATAEA